MMNMYQMKKSGMHSYNIKKPPLERKWYECPNCGKSLLIYDNTAVCSGVYMRCKKCGKEIEIKI